LSEHCKLDIVELVLVHDAPWRSPFGSGLSILYKNQTDTARCIQKRGNTPATHGNAKLANCYNNRAPDKTYLSSLTPNTRSLLFQTLSAIGTEVAR
jgi:hypothetical protein